jgi:hypothetical protein
MINRRLSRLVMSGLPVQFCPCAVLNAFLPG